MKYRFTFRGKRYTWTPTWWQKAIGYAYGVVGIICGAWLLASIPV